MNSKQRWFAFAAIIALGAALGVACGGGEEEERDLCADVECLDPATTCDPTDGICKCGTGDDRIICKSNEICQAEPDFPPACLQNSCAGVTCDGGETCDPTDGVCKCGAVPCSEGQVCSQNRCVIPDPCVGKLCPEGQTCDPSDGACKCGGEICGEDERCDEGVCVEDPCKGVHCGGLSVCNPDDRACHCGTVTGEVCMTGESCVEENGIFFCDKINPCENVDCPGESICDPNDGACRCGGIGEEYPICRPGQVCYEGECRGGSLCADVECAPGFECDPWDGLCKCGGRLCAEDETCMSLGGDAENPVFECVPKCDPLDLTACDDGMSCYVDFSLRTYTGYCAPTGSTALGDTCNVPHDCGPQSTCLGTAERACHALCSLANNGSDCPGWSQDRLDIQCVPGWQGNDQFGRCIGEP